MGYKFIFDFTLQILFKDWSIFHALFMSVLGVISFMLPADVNLKYKIALIMTIAVATFIAKVIKQAYGYYLNSSSPIKALRKVNGDGAFSGKSIVVLAPSPVIQKGVLLTMFCRSSGATQPICNLQVLSASTDEILATPVKADIDINKYFEEEARRQSLFVSPVINPEMEQFS